MKQPNRISLEGGTKIDTYVIERLIGRGGFSLIYLAEDTENKDKVVIKEYLPKRFARRNDEKQVSVIAENQRDKLAYGRLQFYEEAKVLASLNHHNIVSVRNFFLANQTAYLVMDYASGRNLGSYIRKRGGRLSETLITTVFPPLFEALSLIHSRSLLHLDIKPANIHLRPGGHPLLLDFGAVHQISDEPKARLGQVITTGYSPVEQYTSRGYVGPWSDIYAAGATMRACIEGKPPISAVERNAKDKMKPAARAFRRRYPAYLLDAIDWAMELNPEFRPRSARELQEAITGKTGRPSISHTKN